MKTTHKEETESKLKLDPEQLKETASELADQAAKVIQKYPLQSVGAALVAGVLLGLFIKRK